MARAVGDPLLGGVKGPGDPPTPVARTDPGLVDVYKREHPPIPHQPPAGNGGTSPPPGTGMTTDANGNPITTQDAVAILSQELTSWGFGQDAIDWAKAQIQSNNSIDQILYSLRQQDFYKKSIFGLVAAERTANNLPAMTEAQILSYKDYAIGVAQQAGLPPGFIDTPELVTLMGNDVSTAELDARITQGYVAALKSDPATLAAFRQYEGLGVGPGALAAFYLDPTKALPLIQQMFAAAQMGGAAANTGYGGISEAQAQLLAQLGTTQTQAETGFTALAKQHELFNALPGEGAPAITQEMQLAAEFAGNAEDQQMIKQRGEQRAAAFAGNYKFAETPNRGITGLGPVPRNG